MDEATSQTALLFDMNDHENKLVRKWNEQEHIPTSKLLVTGH